MNRGMKYFMVLLLLLSFSNLAEAALKLEEIVIDPKTLPADCQARVPFHGIRCLHAGLPEKNSNRLGILFGFNV